MYEASMAVDYFGRDFLKLAVHLSLSTAAHRFKLAVYLSVLKQDIQ